MIAYSKQSIDAIEIRKETNTWLKLGLIDSATKSNIFNSYPKKFKTTTLFAKVGSFIFTFLAVVASVSLLSVISMGILDILGMTGTGIGVLISAILCTLFLEKQIQENNLYRSGIDNALIYYSAFSAIASFVMMINFHSSLIIYFIAFVIFVGYSIRYADLLMSVSAYISLLCFFYYLLLGVGFSILPFSFMLFSALAYFTSNRQLNSETLKYWRKCLQSIRVASLLSFYIAGNYFVIRSATENLFYKRMPEGQDIPMAIFFYIFTAVIPLLYIYWALRSKDRYMLFTGLVITVASSLTFKHYFSLGHPEILLTAVGALLILIAYVSIRYLKTPRHGLTYEADMDRKELEALAIAQTFGKVAGPNEGSRMGDGEFGGGGAGGGF